ncbi:uncharacterized protein EKO05_0011195 [Ascochyta rabiei]|uniref:Uncharacterized protein n=1 Tax=Didymella rabiei TaxID=5454 RepID=A0A163D809_DIDRA|nr:uncharacterized protein EKO05_0011195 [Ascochyta rabiei]KZM22978.1 hypothetical protein ST47_g5884 [Ascochyta rabiei]UPX20989.1 hypothetical protein EKO05_0011195 [Ascochyta rabiei]
MGATQPQPQPQKAASSIAIGDEPVVLQDRLATPGPPATTTTPDASPAWNTNRLGLRLGSDALAAGAAGVLVAPVITMIDKGIMENASGRNALGDSLKKSARELVARPHRFLAAKPFVLIFSLYFGTYLTANTIDTLASSRAHTPLASTTAGTTKFLATSTSNLALCLYKDNQFTQLFGSTTGPKRPVPLPTFALFTVRDCLTIFASFNLPPLLAPRLESHMSDELRKYVGAASIAQFATPAAIQLVSTPLHLLGLDLYNRPHARMRGPDGRVHQVVKNWAKSALARIGRIVPAFGVGGVVNMKVRQALMGRLDGC